jgi:hypothetical protein
VSIGSFEIVVCALVAGGALGVSLVLSRLVCRGARESVRWGCLSVMGLPLLFVAAMLVTPPDVITMLMVAIPLCVLYGVGVGVWLLVRCRKGR